MTSYQEHVLPLILVKSNRLVFFFEGAGHHRNLHSFPTRRSSDLSAPQAKALATSPPTRMPPSAMTRSEEHTSELQSHSDLVCRLLLEKKKAGRFHTTYLDEAHAARNGRPFAKSDEQAENVAAIAD